MKEEKNVKLPFFGIPKLYPYIKPYLKKILLMIFLGVISSLFDSVYPIFNRYALDNFVVKNTLKGLPAFIILYVVVLIVQVVDNFVTCALCGQVEMCMDRDLRNASFNHLQELSFDYFNRNNVGYMHARVMSDTGKIGVMVAWRMMDVIWNGSYILWVFVMMTILNPRLAAYVLVMVPIAAVIAIYFQKRLLVLNRKIREINSTITGNFNEGITGAKAIKSLVVEGKITDDFEKDTEKMRRESVHSTHYSALFSSLITMLSTLSLALILWKGGKLSTEGFMQIGTLTVFISYALGLLEPVQNVIVTISEMIALQVNVERLFKLLETESDVSDSKEVIEKYGDTFNPKKENWEPLVGDIEFKDVSFRYPDGDEYVLENFNLKVPKGTNVAIVGETGAGKSTLVNLVCRFFKPTKGQILIDGRDAAERSLLWLHSNLGYVLQTPHLFSGSVRDNLRYGKADATDEEIMEALRLVSAEDIIKKMEKGLDSDVGEDGGMLSTGEKQLLSFARAILADPKILILDEATSSIDTVTERAIQDAIVTVTKGRTSFVIAHRLSTIVDADIILVVRDGKITERGKHKELMALKGYYYDLFTRQFDERSFSLI